MAENKINNKINTKINNQWWDSDKLDTAVRAVKIRKMVPPGCEPAGPGAISAWVAGVPAPQGSKRALGAGRPGGRIRLVESSTRVKPWRADVREAFTDRVEFEGDWYDVPRGGLMPGVTAVLPYAPVVVKIVFVMPRPKATPKTRATPPMVKKPDLDKLVRAVLDALTSAGVYADDGQVVAVHAFKRLAELGEPTGAMIHVEPFQMHSDQVSTG